MSSPSFVPERNEIWYSDGLSGFYAVRLTNGMSVTRGRRRSGGAPLPRAPVADRAAQRRPRPARVHARPPPPRAGAPGPDHAPLLPLLREAQLRPGHRGVLTPRPRRARRHHGTRARQPPPAPRLARAGARAAPTRAGARSARGIYRANPRSPRLIGVTQGPGPLLRGRVAQAAAEQARADAPPAPGRAAVSAPIRRAARRSRRWCPGRRCRSGRWRGPRSCC